MLWNLVPQFLHLWLLNGILVQQMRARGDRHVGQTPPSSRSYRTTVSWTSETIFRRSSIGIPRCETINA